MAKRYRIFLDDEIGEELKRLMTIVDYHQQPLLIIKTGDYRTFKNLKLLPYPTKIMAGGKKIRVAVMPYKDGVIFTWLAKGQKSSLGDGIIIKELQVEQK